MGLFSWFLCEDDKWSTEVDNYNDRYRKDAFKQAKKATNQEIKEDFLNFGNKQKKDLSKRLTKNEKDTLTQYFDNFIDAGNKEIKKRKNNGTWF